MAYQNVGTPRFYINVLEWLSATGNLSYLENIYRTLPVNPANVDDDTLSLTAMTDKGFVAILGHNFPDNSNYAQLQVSDVAIDLSNVVNSAGNQTNQVSPQYSGFSIATFSEPDIDSFWVASGGSTAGSIVIGTYYDMPHSPDLSLSMERSYSGIKTMETKGGASLSNTFYTKPPKWGIAEAWGLHNGTPYAPKLARSGRRIWDLSFSYLQDSDVFPMMASIEPYESMTDLGTPYSDGAEGFASNTMLDSNSFFSQVVHRVQGSRLPFIFQPDGDGDTPGSGNNNPDQFAICKFDSGFKFKQVANNVYNVKLKIREVW